jgi:[protein-PII] uridylyltransferase
MNRNEEIAPDPRRRDPDSEKHRLSAGWERLRQDGSLQGREWSKAATALTDAWLMELFRRACAPGERAVARGAAEGARGDAGEAGGAAEGAGVAVGRGAFSRWRNRQQGRQLKPPQLQPQPAGGGLAQGLALMAVGSLGRGDLAPGSDLDLLLVHTGRPDVTELADRLWYPIWDDPMPLDHSVRTLEQVALAAESDLRVALGLLDARLVAGDPELAGRLAQLTERLWEKRVTRWLPYVLDARSAAQDALGEVAFRVEPDLQEARGGLRDVQVVKLLRKVAPVSLVTDGRLQAAADLLHSVRVEIQRPNARRSEKLLLEDHDRVAVALGIEGREALARAVAEAGRTVAWVVEDAERRARSWLAGPRGRGGSADKPLGPGLVLRDDEVVVPAGTPIGADPTLALRAAAAAAELGLPINRQTLARLAEAAPAPPEPWPAEALRAFLRLLSTGAAGVHATETLDQLGIWERYLPEWSQARNRPQFDPYHRWTVDRHLLETVANAATHLSDVGRPDLLLLSALLHDIGKGAGTGGALSEQAGTGAGPAGAARDHAGGAGTISGHAGGDGTICGHAGGAGTISGHAGPGAGTASATNDHSHAGAEIARRVAQRLGLSGADTEVVVKVVLHHLLLPDTATRRDVEDRATAEAVATTVGDTTTLELLAALAPADGMATGPSAWSEWKGRLVERLVERAGALLAGSPLPEGPPFPDDRQRRLLASGTLQVLPGEQDLVVVAPDRPGLLSDVTGALALHSVGILEARVHSEEGWALEVLRLDLLDGAPPRWERIRADVEGAVLGRFNVSEALARHEQATASKRRRRSRASPPASVRVQVDNGAATDATVLEIRAPDTQGLLHRVTATLAGLGLDISSARAATLGATAIDTFYVRSGGTKLSNAAAEAAKEALQRLLAPVQAANGS